MTSQILERSLLPLINGAKRQGKNFVQLARCTNSDFQTEMFLYFLTEQKKIAIYKHLTRQIVDEIFSCSEKSISDFCKECGVAVHFHQSSEKRKDSLGNGAYDYPKWMHMKFSWQDVPSAPELNDIKESAEIPPTTSRQKLVDTARGFDRDNTISRNW